jgi:hypothetical protein
MPESSRQKSLFVMIPGIEKEVLKLTVSSL